MTFGLIRQAKALRSAFTGSPSQEDGGTIRSEHDREGWELFHFTINPQPYSILQGFGNRVRLRLTLARHSGRAENVRLDFTQINNQSLLYTSLFIMINPLPILEVWTSVPTSPAISKIFFNIPVHWDIWIIVTFLCSFCMAGASNSIYVRLKTVLSSNYLLACGRFIQFALLKPCSRCVDTDSASQDDGDIYDSVSFKHLCPITNPPPRSC